jgi:2-polyprenyl-3-methyl-5-hydroxy-6-metoxy-1,4-benzoquinol methylase
MENFIEDKYGVLRAEKIPTEDELREYYNNKYFDSGTYAVEYSLAELKWKNIVNHEFMSIANVNGGSFLDIGCGEGISLNFFRKKADLAKGIDFSDDGVKRQSPEALDNFLQCNVFDEIKRMSQAGEKFDYIMSNNVLEHVIDIYEFVEIIKNLFNENTIMRIQVPNDNSFLQNFVYDSKKVVKRHWQCVPDHLSYFNRDAFTKFLEENGYEIVDFLGDFPIEMFLLNKASNYVSNPEVGSLAHEARVDYENALFESSPEKYMEYKRGMGLSSISRSLTAYIRLKK